MKFIVTYKKPKKKGHFSEQTATFFSIDDAEFWSKHVEEQGARDLKILVN